MAGSEYISFALRRQIRLVFAGDVRKSQQNKPGAHSGIPGSFESETNLTTKDCQYIWEEVQYADKIQKLGQCFEESSKMLLQHLQDDQLTQRDKTTFLNFLCQSRAISIRMLSLHQDSPPVLTKRINPKHPGQKASTSTPAYACQTPQQSLPKSGRDWHRATEQMMSTGNSENSIQRKSCGNVMKVKTSLAKKKKPLKNHRFRINQMGKMAKRQIAKRNSASAGTRSRCEEMDISNDSSCVSLTASGIVQHVSGNSEGGSLRLQNVVQKQEREVQNLPTDVKQPESDSGSQTFAVRSNESEIHGRGTDAENWYSDSAVQCQGSESEQQSDSDAVVNCQDNAIFDSEGTVDSQQHEAPDSELNTSQCQQFDGQCQQTDGQCQQIDGRCQQADGQCQQIDGQCQQIDGQCQQTNGQSQQTNGQSQENIGLCQQKVGQNQGNVLQGQQNVAGSQPGETSGSVNAIECQENRLADSEKFTQCQEHGSTYPESFVQSQDNAFEGSARTGQCQQSSDLESEAVQHYYGVKIKTEPESEDEIYCLTEITRESVESGENLDSRLQSTLLRKSTSMMRNRQRTSTFEESIDNDRAHDSTPFCSEVQNTASRDHDSGVVRKTAQNGGESMPTAEGPSGLVSRTSIGLIKSRQRSTHIARNSKVVTNTVFQRQMKPKWSSDSYLDCHYIARSEPDISDAIHGVSEADILQDIEQTILPSEHQGTIHSGINSVRSPSASTGAVISPNSLQYSPAGVESQNVLGVDRGLVFPVRGWRPLVSGSRNTDTLHSDASNLNQGGCNDLQSVEKVYKCSICGEQTTWKNNHLRHMKIHTGEKRYQCSYCGKRFPNKYNLTCHIRIHTGEKPYRCEICGTRFSQRSSYNVHRRRHTGEMPLRCKICKISFPAKFYLMLHMKVHL